LHRSANRFTGAGVAGRKPPLGSAPNHAASPGILAYYLCNEQAGTHLIDLTGRYHSAGVTGGASRAADGILFDGVTTTNIALPAGMKQAGATSPFTVSMWFKTTQGVTGTIYSEGNTGQSAPFVSVRLLSAAGGTFTNNNIWFLLRDDNNSAMVSQGLLINSNPLNDGGIHNVIITSGGSASPWASWIDGQLAGSGTASAATGSLTLDTVTLGNRAGALNNPFAGTFLHGGKWQGVITAAQAYQLYNDQFVMVQRRGTYRIPKLAAAGPISIQGIGVASSEVIGTPAIARASDIAVGGIGIGTSEVIGTPAIQVNSNIAIGGIGVASSELVAVPVIQVTSDIMIGGIGVPSSEGFGTPAITGGALPPPTTYRGGLEYDYGFHPDGPEPAASGG
jgi:hypothetical protein